MVSDKNETVLAVCLITYNHVKFIRQAIEGILMQKVNFSWQLIIADDYSIDGTREIILEYKNKYPDFIHLIFQDKNVGPAKNWLDLITRPRSKYIAYFEGDDYWTDPLKLQKQVDFLESNSDYAIHFMNARTIDNKSCELTSQFLSHTKHEFTIDDFISTSNPICTLTAVFKNSKKLQSDEFNLILDYPYGDWGFWIFILYHSGLKVKYDATVGASYRIHDQGVFSTKKPVETLNKFIKIQELNLIIIDYYLHN
jgi:glycosyltransferase involved in cell wall biosynthesis